MDNNLTDLQIELSGICNARCPYCTWQTRVKSQKQYMDFKLATDAIDEASRLGVSMVRYHSTGESLLHPRVIDILQYANRVVPTNLLSTNASLLQGGYAAAIADLKSFHLVCSIHWRGGNETWVDNCIANVQAFLENGFACRKVVVQMVCAKEDESQFTRFYQSFAPAIAKRERAELYFKQPCTFPNDKTPQLGFIPPMREFECNTHLDMAKTPQSIGRSCSLPKYSLAILADGTVVPCCVGMEDWGLPSFNDHTLSEIWGSDRMKEIRTLWGKADRSIPCGECIRRTDC